MADTTRRACVMGWPAKHSRSPKLHGYWLKKYGIDGDYRVEERTPEEFPEFVRNLAMHGYVGGNVTMPHKDAAFAIAAPDERAKAVGAANTLWLDNGRLRATNTDVEGFIGALDSNAPGWDQRFTSSLAPSCVARPTSWRTPSRSCGVMVWTSTPSNGMNWGSRPAEPFATRTAVASRVVSSLTVGKNARAASSARCSASRLPMRKPRVSARASTPGPFT